MAVSMTNLQTGTFHSWLLFPQSMSSPALLPVLQSSTNMQDSRTGANVTAEALLGSMAPARATRNAGAARMRLVVAVPQTLYLVLGLKVRFP